MIYSSFRSGWFSTVMILSSAAGCGDGARSPPEGSGDSDELGALLTAGADWYAEGEYDSASARYDTALALARHAGDASGEALALYGLGKAGYGRDDFGSARDLVARAMAIQDRLGLDDQLFDSHSLLGLIGYYEGQYYQSEASARTALLMAEAMGDTAKLLKAWNNLALPLTELGKFPEARSLLVSAAGAARALRNARYESRILTNLGMLSVRTGNPDTALTILGTARLKAREAGDVESELNALGQLGTAFAARGEHGLAIAALDSAVTIARDRALPQEEVSNLELLADIYRQTGEYPRALRLFAQAQVLNQRLGLRDEAAANLGSVAQVHFELGNGDLARRSLTEALDLHRELGARLSEFLDLLLLARVAAAADEPVEAGIRLREAETIAHSVDSRAARLAVGLTGARLADRVGDNEEVARRIRGIRGDLAAGGTDAEWETHWLVGRAHARSGMLQQAAAEGHLAVQAIERIRGGLGSGLLRSSFVTEREAVYADLVDVLLQLGRTEDAFEVADRARGRVLVDQLATEQTNGGPSVRDLAEEERQLLRQIDTITTHIDRTRAQQAGVAEVAFRAELRKLYDELDRIRGDYAEAVVRADERSPEVLALAGGVAPDAGRIRAALDPGEALLAFLEGPESVRLFVVTRDGVTAFTSPVERSALGTRVRVTRELLLRPGTNAAATRALEALHEVLLGQARRAGALAGMSSLIVVPHGQLSYLPFAALRDPSSGRYLVEDFALLHLPSAAALPVLRRGLVTRPISRSTTAMAFAPFPRELPGTLAEVETLRGALPVLDIRRGRDATEPKVRAALRDAGIVHLATHGALNARSPLFSRIELYRGQGGPMDDGRLEVHEVTRLQIGARLVFLSGCETGLGTTGSTGFSVGEDYATLARAFLQAGAANVIATLWRVEDAGGAVFAGRFYQELASTVGRPAGGRGFADVLSRAQRETLRDARYASPYYWAGYQLSGDGGAGPIGEVVPGGL